MQKNPKNIIISEKTTLGKISLVNFDVSLQNIFDWNPIDTDVAETTSMSHVLRKLDNNISGLP